ncbi:MAG: hypothetical protein IT441_07240, partial [Phycisphaeraceae bacterium]|nr:hypothetical protein [Phycisphaeraceae bacterium]
QVNADIAADLPVYTDVAEQGQALRIKGLRAVFGEKYPPKVRVVSIGAPVKDLLSDPASDRWAKLSIEFCGGTHLAKTGDAEGLVIVSEEAVAKGVRRITAQTGPLAHQTQARADMLLARVGAIKGLPAEKIEAALGELTEAIGKESLPAIARAKLREGFTELQKLLKEQKKQESKASAGAAVDVARQIAETAEGDLIVAELPGGADATALRSAMDVIRKKLPGAALLLAGVSGEGADAKVALIAAVPAEKIAVGLKAGDWVKQAAQAAGGSGGGKPDMAQAGAKDVSKLPAALEAARAYAQRILAAAKA